MKAVIELKLVPADPAKVLMPAGSSILNVYPTPSGPVVVVEVDPDQEEQVVTNLYTRMSGSPLPEDKMLAYVGSFHAIKRDEDSDENIPILFHVYRDLEEEPYTAAPEEV